MPWAFTKNHRLTFGLSSNFLQIPTTQALSLILAILLHNLGLTRTIETKILKAIKLELSYIYVEAKFVEQKKREGSFLKLKF